MQPHERVRIEPMAAGPVPAIDQGDLHLRMAGQGVGESHARRPGSDYQVVSLERTWHCGHSTTGPDTAEGVGFEPTVDPKAHNGFRDRPVQPLRHPSGESERG